MVNKKFFFVLFGALVLLAVAFSAQAQTSGASLSAGSASGMPGDSDIVIPVRLDPDEGTEITGLNFDLTFDTNRLSVQNVTIGSAAASAEKSLSWSSPSSGRIRVIIFGLNQTKIQNGVVADVTFSVNAVADPGSSSLSLSNATATDQDGVSVPLSLSPGTFTIPDPPSATLTATVTQPPQPSATKTRTATILPTNTVNPTNTQAAVSTATRSPPSTATQASTLPYGSTLQPSPTGIGTSTETTALSNSPTPTLSGTDDPGSSAADAAPALSSTQLADSFELAVIATCTALAEEEDAKKGANDSVAEVDTGTYPGDLLRNQITDLLNNSSLMTSLFLGTGVVNALFVPPVAIYLYRNRATFSKLSKKTRSPHSSSRQNRRGNR